MAIKNLIIYDRRKIFGALDEVFTRYQNYAQEGNE